MQADDTPDTLFTNRAAELERFDQLIDGLSRGRRRHLALLGLRRIGKTVLLDEVRRRHPTSAIAYLGTDEVVSTPKQFARAFAAEVLHAAIIGSGRVPADRLEDNSALLGGRLARQVNELLAIAERAEPNGELLAAAFRLPDASAEQLGIPLVIMLDEFQDIDRLRHFPNLLNLLGVVRAALDRPGTVAYVVAGSHVTALRTLLSHGDSPFFTRFEQLELGPFAPPATAELSLRILELDGVTADADAPTRLHRLTGGWPFYVQAIATRCGQLARAAGEPVTSDLVDTAFEDELLGRGGAIGQQCRYLLAAAIQTDADDLRNTLDAVVRQVASLEWTNRAALAESLAGDHDDRQVYRAVNRLIETDFLREEGGRLVLLDGVFRLWLALEPARRDPSVLRTNPDARRKLLTWYETQHAENRQNLGSLFERRIENLARQFRGQEVDGSYFGIGGTLRLPTVREAGKIRVEDRQARFGPRPDVYEVDVVTLGDGPDDQWAIEAKHRVGAITRAMVQRFLANADGIERARGLRFARRWMVAPRGIRADAQELARQHGLLTTGRRGLERLERLLTRSFDERLAGGP